MYSETRTSELSAVGCVSSVRCGMLCTQCLDILLCVNDNLYTVREWNAVAFC